MPSTAATPPVTPASLLHSFDQGMQMGAPMSAAANAVPPMGPVEPQMPEPAAPTPNVAATSPASAHVPVIDTPHAPAADVAPLPPRRTPRPAMLARPTSPASADGNAVRCGRTRWAIACLWRRHPTAGLGSCRTAHRASGSSAGNCGVGAGQLIKQCRRDQPARGHASTRHGAHALANAGRSRRAGRPRRGGRYHCRAASAATTAKARLQRLVDFVARQEPRLNWAAGDRPDGTTVLVTDLASGWIPPEIDIPVGMQLRDPAKRRGDLESLLGEVTVTASYTRLHQVPPADDDEPVPTSPRARQGPVVEELGWELGQATNWRDGLPRLAHTLAKAASRGTGVLDKEIEVLQELLAEFRDRVLDSYPDNVDAAAVGNWQLLAAIDALVEGDKTGRITTSPGSKH
ncbi:hypothetical protein I553_1053 [Mycobacterium xenopi 4042]|uniref:DUF5632 domain-containing protein n=1 Tax=Mycobacterium xenopi 4042 TaxID=1299334 RepID=X7ZBC5_MYCXE|nr:hypothetical protein I553_1053 [Mycobacterium xenopi 4042]